MFEALFQPVLSPAHLLLLMVLLVVVGAVILGFRLLQR